MTAVPNNTIATQLYRIAQESLNNALQHGQPTEILISLSLEADHIILEVSDDGIGIAAQVIERHKEAAGGMGLRIMEYRANLIGGMLRVMRNSDRGTTVRCEVTARGA